MNIYNLLCPFGDYMVIITKENKYIVHYCAYNALYWYCCSTENTWYNSSDSLTNIIKHLKRQQQQNYSNSKWEEKVFKTPEEHQWLMEAVEGLVYDEQNSV